MVHLKCTGSNTLENVDNIESPSGLKWVWIIMIWKSKPLLNYPFNTSGQGKNWS